MADTPTDIPVPTLTATPTPVPTLGILSLVPAAVVNDQAARIAVVGAGFVDTSYSITVGGRPLSNVQVDSLTQLSGTLAPGLCPGLYPVLIQDIAGHQVSVSGGSIALTSVRTIALDAAPPATSLTLNGHAQWPSVALPPVRIEDSSCGSSDWRILLAVDIPKSGAGKTVTAGTLTVRSSDGTTTSVTLSPSGGQEQGTLVLARNGLTSLFLTPALELVVPANTYAGSYSTTLSASFAD